MEFVGELDDRVGVVSCRCSGAREIEGVWGWKGRPDDKCLGDPIEGDKVGREGCCRPQGNDRAVDEEEESAGCEEVRAHADAEFSFWLSIRCGLMGACEGLAFVDVLGDHTTGTEWEESAHRFDAAYKFIGGGWGAADIDEGVADSGDGFVEVEGVLEREVVWESG